MADDVLSMTATHPFGAYAHALLAMAHHDVEFVVCGGVACVFHGVPRENDHALSGNTW